MKLLGFSFGKSAPTTKNSNIGLSVRSTTKPKNSITTSSLDGGFSGGGKTFDGLSGSGKTLYINSRTLSKNARVAYRDSIEARAIVDRNVDVVTDVGIKLDPTANASILGISEAEAEDWNNAVRERFDLYMSSKKCNRSRKMNGYEAQRLFNKSLLIDNDQYTHFFFEKERDSISKVSFEFIDPMDIIGDGVLGTDGTSNTYDGIIRDNRGRETHYMVKVRDVNGAYTYKKIPAKRAGRTVVSHGFISDQISQLRGNSQVGHILQEFQNMTDFKLSHISKAIQQANIALAIENDGETDPSDPFEDVTTAAGKKTVTELKSTGLSDEDIESLHIDRMDDFSSSGTGSLSIVNLRAKDKVKMLSNTAPVTNYDKFVEAFTSHMAASARMPIEVLLMKFGQNYSASRAALLLFYRVAEIYRSKIDVDFITPLYENWLAEEIADGRVVCVGWSDPIIKQAWLSHSLISAPVPNIDPLKSAKAKKEEIAIGATTLDRAAQDINGSNGKANRAALVRELQELEIPYWEKNNAEVEQNQPEED